jgi:hypothetical protein
MSKLDQPKLIPRNAPALRKLRDKNPQPHLVAGNPISTRLESGIGNCFPGLECDLRNLERRFFPFLEMDMPDVEISLLQVNIDGAVAARKAGKITQANLDAYWALHKDAGWIVETMSGTFGPLGHLTLTMASLKTTSTGPGRAPPDPWTAVRLLTEGTEVRLVFQLNSAPTAKKVAITAKRERYLGDDGALAAMFLPGELTQSLCSPWTHDFRDCACFYWASNHPDIALPPLPSKHATDPVWNFAVPWERSDRTIGKRPPAKATVADADVLDYYRINEVWQSLNFVLERREQRGPYVQRGFAGKELDSKAELETHLRYAAGVELAVLQEYLTAAYSLKPAGDLTGRIGDDVRAAYAEIMRIAIGEMRHLRAVNDVLAAVVGRPLYTPALGVATALPGAKPGQWWRVVPNPLTAEALQRFIDIEAPSESVDGVYARILATLNQQETDLEKKDENIQAIRTIMAEGEDHYRTFRDIQEWLKPYLHDETKYLRRRNLTLPPQGNKANQVLQQNYQMLLELLYKGYKAGMPNGAENLNQARNLMIAKKADKNEKLESIADAARAVADGGFLVSFVTPTGPHFKPVNPPDPKFKLSAAS